MADNISGVVYVAYGEQHQEELKQSIESVKQHCDLPIFVIDNGPLLDEVPFLINKPYVLSQATIPFHQFLFLDTDTRVLGNVALMFDILENFDIAASHFYKRNDNLMTELSTGVILMKNNRQFLRDWSEAALKYWYNTKDNNDQPAFTDIIYNNELRLYTLPPEFNLRVSNLIYASGPAWILHGRHRRLEMAVRTINNSIKPRVWNGKKQHVSELKE